MAISLQLSSPLVSSGSASAASAGAADASSSGLFAELFASALPAQAVIAAAEDKSGATEAVVSADPDAAESETDAATTVAPDASLLVAIPLPPQPVVQPVTPTAVNTESLAVEVETASAAKTLKPEAIVLRQTPPDAKAAPVATESLPEAAEIEPASLLDTAKADNRLPLTSANSADSGVEVARWMSGLKADSLMTNSKTSSQLDTQTVVIAPTAAHSQTQTLQAVTSAAAPQTMNRVAEPVGDSRWAEALGQRTLMMLSEQTRSAELELNPPHLGPLSVKLSLDGESASVSFVTAQPVVREALQQSVNRLQSVFAENGFLALDVNVQLGQHRQPQQEQASRDGQSSFRQAAEPDDEVAVAALGGNAGAASRRVGIRSAVDMFV